MCIVVSYLGWVSAQITALGLVFNVPHRSSISMNQGMMIGAGVVLMYTLFGGMWSVAITTFVQMIVIVLGLFYIAWEVSDLAGGVGNVVSHAAAAGKFEWLPEANIGAIIAWIATFATMASARFLSKTCSSAYNSARNERIAVHGTVLGGVAASCSPPSRCSWPIPRPRSPSLVARLMGRDSQLILPTSSSTTCLRRPGHSSVPCCR